MQKYQRMITLCALSLSAAPLALAQSPAQAPKLTAAQIVERHIAARGGAQAWAGVQTLQLSGQVEAGKGSGDAGVRKQILSGKRISARGDGTTGTPQANDATAAREILLPFTMDVKRPNKTRLEIEFAGQTAVQVYDGVNGWKVRPFLNNNTVEPFSAQEKQAEASRVEPEGPLVASAGKADRIA
jgi:hypothetical protein